MISRNWIAAETSAHPAQRTTFCTIAAASCASILVVTALQFTTPGSGQSGIFLLCAGVVSLALPALVLIPPTIPLFLAVMFLESPLPALLDNKPSALVTAVLFGLAAIGCVFSPPIRSSAVSIVTRRSVWFFGGCALISALKGLQLGNSAEYVVGDLFQVEEFVIAFILVDRLITDQRTALRLLKCALGATYINSVWQLVLVVTGFTIGEGLPFVDGDVGGFLPRTINLNAI